MPDVYQLLLHLYKNVTDRFSLSFSQEQALELLKISICARNSHQIFKLVNGRSIIRNISINNYGIFIDSVKSSILRTCKNSLFQRNYFINNDWFFKSNNSSHYFKLCSLFQSVQVASSVNIVYNVCIIGCYNYLYLKLTLKMLIIFTQPDFTKGVSKNAKYKLKQVLTSSI